MTSPYTDAYRLKWLDYSRGFTILMVIYAHLRNSLLDSGVLQDAEALIYYGRIVTACTMPVFFFMSGNFIRSAACKPFAVFLDDKLRTIAYPYFLWSAAYFLASYALGFHSPHWSDIDRMWTIVYQPRAHMWFFYALFCAGLLFAGASKARIHPAGFLVLSLVFHSTRYLGLDLSGIKVIDDLRQYLPYFALGAVVNRGEPLVWLSESPTPRLITLLLSGYGVSTVAVVNGWHLGDAGQLVPVLAGTVALMSMAILLERFGRLRLIALIGRFSMEIYVAHVFGYQAARIFLQHVLGIENAAVHFAFDMSAGIAAPLLLVWVVRRIGFRYLFTLRGLKLGASGAVARPVARVTGASPD